MGFSFLLKNYSSLNTHSPHKTLNSSHPVNQIIILQKRSQLII